MIFIFNLTITNIITAFSCNRHIKKKLINTNTHSHTNTINYLINCHVQKVIQLETNNWIKKNLVSVYPNQFSRCLRRICDVIVSENPELALFFDIYDSLELNRINPNELNFCDSQNVVKNSTVCNSSSSSSSVGIQTELHPIPYNKDKNYTWNLWNKRRTAIKLTHLQNCKTHSTQTTSTAYRYQFGTQTE